MVDEREGGKAKETKMAEQRKKWERLYKFFEYRRRQERTIWDGCFRLFLLRSL